MGPAAHAAPVQIQILATNDFHGRLLNNISNGEAGAAVLSGAVKQLRAANPNTVFAAAGDLIGASTFESFIQRDKPTLDALNEAGLQVSAAGNHEFDQGYNDLVNRVMKPASASNPQGGANWQYLAANVRKKSDGSYALPAASAQSDGATWYQDFGSVRVGFVGAVTEDLPSLVSPAGIADVAVSNIVTEVNAAADRLSAPAIGADIVVLLVHEGAATTALSSATDPNTAFGKIVNGVDSDVDAIVSGHTHLAYNHLIGGRPVVSAGQYGTALNQLIFTVDSVTGVVSGVTSNILNLKTGQTPNYPADAATTTIVNQAVAQSAVLGALPLGHIAGEFRRAKLVDGTTENRGGESTLGNLVAEVQRWATSTPTAGGAQIAFMNPGGLRDDMIGNSTTGFPAVLTYKQAAVVQPFANTLVNMRLPGLRSRRSSSSSGSATAPATSPPGPSCDSARRRDSSSPSTRPGPRATGSPASGSTASRWSRPRRTPSRSTPSSPPAVTTSPSSPRAPERATPARAPKAYRIGQQVSFSLSSLAMSAPKDKRDATLDVKIGTVSLKGATVNNVLGIEVFDNYGTSNVSSRLTGKVPTGAQTLTVTGPTTGTTLTIPIKVLKAQPTLTAKVKPGKVVAGQTKARVKVGVTAPGLQHVKGKVKVKAGGKTYQAKLSDGKLVVKLSAFTRAGKKKIFVKYLGTKSTQAKKHVVRIKVRNG